jgi:hypothetical protein
MTKTEIEGWLWASRLRAIAQLGFDAGWWPMTNTTGHANRQGEASAWALAFFLQASLDRCFGKRLTAACNTARDETATDSFRQRLIDAFQTGGSRRFLGSQLGGIKPDPTDG